MSYSSGAFHILESGSLQQSLILRNAGRQHPHFYFPDGDLLLASATVDFRVHFRELTLRSETLSSVFESKANSKSRANSQEIIYLPILEDDPAHWACLLGLIYNEQAAAQPTLHELLGIIRTSQKYGFVRIEAWAVAHLRADFFLNPDYFQEDPEGSLEAEDKLVNALLVIAASHRSKFEIATLALAFYAVASRDPYRPATFKLLRRMPQDAWHTMLTGRAKLERRFELLKDNLINVAGVGRPTIVGHCISTCRKLLAQWVADAKITQPDALRALRQLKDEVPLGPVCSPCLQEAQRVVGEEMTEIYRRLPIYFGFRVLQEDGWVLPEDKKQLLSRSFKL